MKKTTKLLCLLSLTSSSLFTMASCNGKKPSSSTLPTSSPISTATSSSSLTSTTPEPAVNPDLIINYYRFDENYANWGVWAWGGDKNTGLHFKDFTQTTFPETGNWKWASMPIEFGRNYSVYTDWNSPSVTSSETRVKENFDGFLIRDTNGTKDGGNIDRLFDYTKVDKNGVLNVFIVTGNTTNYYSIEDVPTSPIKDIYFNSTTEVMIDTYFAIEDFQEEKLKIVDDENKEYGIESVFPNGSGKKVVLSEEYTDFTKKLTLVYDGEKHEISFKKVYNSAAFNTLYEYTGNDLGAVVQNDGTTVFKLWSPSASKVSLNLYESSTSVGIKETFDMTKGEKGVWSYTSSNNLHGTYYTYTVELFGETNTEVSDPYASSSNANGVRSLVVDWAQITTPSTAAPAVAAASGVTVYETHVRDFSMDKSWNGTESNRGKYLGLIESGTKLEGTNTATGFDYVKSLGVTHIQLQPVYDFNSVDETKLADAEYIAKPRGGVYNWGYDPYCYSSLEGSYSSDPNDGLTRINEFRQVTDAYNKAGIGVIMDVVYNHMPSETYSTYDKIMPDYYFRTNSYSGAGSDLATENAMVRNMMVQTTESLAKHYNLAGFRFDLCGLIAKSTMQAVDKNLRSFDSDVILYGEGWSQYQGDPYLGNAAQTTQGAMYNVNAEKETKFGYFNDQYRDGMKGSVFGATDKGFLQVAYNGTKVELETIDTLKEKVLYGISGTTSPLTGWSQWSRHYAAPSVNYTECHDNLTLHDKLLLTNPDLSEEVRNSMQAAANVTTALSMGISFYQAGNEFGRSKEVPEEWFTSEKISTTDEKIVANADKTKYYVTDSYNFSDEINAIDWSLIDTNASMVSSFKKALALRNGSVLGENLKPTEMSKFGFSDISSELEETLANRVLAYALATDGTNSISYVIINTSNAVLTLPAEYTATGTTYYINGDVSTATELEPFDYYVATIPTSTVTE